MKKNIIIISTLAIFAVSAYGISTTNIFENQEQDEPLQVIDSQEPSPSEVAIIKEEDNTDETIAAPPAREDSAISNDASYISFSDTPLEFPVGELIDTISSVPDVVEIDGDLYVYMTGRFISQLSYVYSNDDGATWTDQAPLEIEGIDKEMIPVDPSVIELPDGRYRLYFFNMKVKPPGVETQDVSVFYSAISDDGVTFEMESGHRLMSDAPITDPNVIWTNENEWLMYFASEEGIGLATSTDGLNFEMQTHLGVDGIPGAMVLDDGSIRLYACGKSGTSQNGIDFEMDAIPKAFGCGPSLIKYKEGYVMVYKALIDEAKAPEL
jgi:hypothetical protein